MLGSPLPPACSAAAAPVPAGAAWRRQQNKTDQQWSIVWPFQNVERKWLAANQCRNAEQLYDTDPLVRAAVTTSSVV